MFNLLGITAALDLSSVDLTPIVTMFETAVPALLTAGIPLIGIRKVVSMIFGTIRGF